MDYSQIITIEPGKRRRRGFPTGGKGAASFQPPTSPSRAAPNHSGGRTARHRVANVCAPPARPLVGGWKLAAPLGNLRNAARFWPNAFALHDFACLRLAGWQKHGG